MENNVTEVASLMEGMVLLQRWIVYFRGNGHVREVASLMGGRMVMLRRWPVQWGENDHVTEVVS